MPKEPTGSPATLDGWEPVAGAADADEVATLKPAPGTRTRYLLVWLTKLPKAGSGFRGEIAEVTVQR